TSFSYVLLVNLVTGTQDSAPMLDATQNYEKPLTRERLLAGTRPCFPMAGAECRIVTGKSGATLHWPMQVVSGALGKEKVHYQAPPFRSS
ncbi:MAG: hypothetical protein MZV63_50830, partial [Marinilabiliales bacterium]|nr:hypothetical protein [Marinilabiliales bacterium]